MIPKEKIKEAAKDSNGYGYPLLSGVIHEAFENGFESGVSFAETELQNIAIEFAEWCTINAKPVTNGKALRYWRLYTYQSSISYSTQHLFAKFMAERQKQ